MLATSPSLGSILIRNPAKPPTPSPEDGRSGPFLTIGELPDPDDRYKSIKSNASICGYEMDLPQVFDTEEDLVLPPDYKYSIPGGTLVAVRGSMQV